MASPISSVCRGIASFFLFVLLLPLRAGIPAATTEAPVPASRGYVTDTAGILGNWAGQTEELCRDIERKTTAEVAVLTVRSTGSLPAQGYAQRVFDRWKIGKKGKDNGVLVLVAVDDRKMWIATGYGVEGVLPDGKAGEIRDKVILPLFREGQYGEGIYRGVSVIGEILRGEKGTIPRPATPLLNPWGWVILLFLAGILVYAVFMRLRYGKKWVDVWDKHCLDWGKPDDGGGSYGGGFGGGVGGGGVGGGGFGGLGGGS